jgi:hypothetical protein
MSDVNPWHEPDDAQILSDRTVFRFQQIANLLKQDLQSLDGFNGNLESVLFAQRDWKHTGTKAGGRYYNASFCATYSLEHPELKVVLEELKNANENSNDACVTSQELLALFGAYDAITGHSASSATFTEAMARELFGKAHEILVEAASAIPYKGELPTAFDNHSGDHPAAYWFTNETGTFKCKATPQLNSTAEYRDLVVDDLSLHPDVDLKKHKCLIALLEKFLNPLLQGKTPDAKGPRSYPGGGGQLHGLAFPCYEETKSDGFSGSFLGWLFLTFRCPTIPALTTSWHSFRFAVNHFSDRIIEATIDEILGEYGKKIDRLEPEDAFATYFWHVEGWEVSDDDGKTLSLPRKLGKDPFTIKIKPKWDTIDTAATLSPSVRMRCHRLHSGLIFVHDNSRVEELQKYRQMLEMLQQPLDGLAKALGNMQRDTQVLRAVLYDPAKALFESHSLLSKLFSEGNKIDVSETVSIIINHSLNYSGGTDDDNEPPERRRGSKKDGQCLVAYALCRIFGRERDLFSYQTRSLLMREAAEILMSCERRDEFEELVEDLKALLFSDGYKAPTVPAPTLASTLQREPKEPLSRLKRVIFDPYKPDATKWDAAALRLAVRRYVKASTCEILPLPGGATDLEMPTAWTPVSFNMVLTFLIEVAAEFCARDGKNGILQLNFEEDGSAAECKPSSYKRIRLQADSSLLSPRYPTGLKDLRCLVVNHVLSQPRDWRVTETEIGNFRKPYVDLASRMLGVQSVWTTIPIEGLCDAPHCKTVFGVEAECRRFRVFFSKSTVEADTVVLAWESRGGACTLLSQHS